MVRVQGLDPLGVGVGIIGVGTHYPLGPSGHGYVLGGVLPKTSVQCLCLGQNLGCWVRP